MDDSARRPDAPDGIFRHPRSVCVMFLHHFLVANHLYPTPTACFQDECAFPHTRVLLGLPCYYRFESL